MRLAIVTILLGLGLNAQIIPVKHFWVEDSEKENSLTLHFTDVSPRDSAWISWLRYLAFATVTNYAPRDFLKDEVKEEGANIKIVFQKSPDQKTDWKKTVATMILHFNEFGKEIVEIPPPGPKPGKK